MNRPPFPCSLEQFVGVKEVSDVSVIVAPVRHPTSASHADITVDSTDANLYREQWPGVVLPITL